MTRSEGAGRALAVNIEVADFTVDGVWFDFDLRPAETTFYIPLRPRDPND